MTVRIQGSDTGANGGEAIRRGMARQVQVGMQAILEGVFQYNSHKLSKYLWSRGQRRAKACLGCYSPCVELRFALLRFDPVSLLL